MSTDNCYTVCDVFKVKAFRRNCNIADAAKIALKRSRLYYQARECPGRGEGYYALYVAKRDRPIKWACWVPFYGKGREPLVVGPCGNEAEVARAIGFALMHHLDYNVQIKHDHVFELDLREKERRQKWRQAKPAA